MYNLYANLMRNLKIKSMAKTKNREGEDLIISQATPYDIPLIIDMQIKNHKSYLQKDELVKGYVTLLTPSDFLHSINHNNHILIARDKTGKACGYMVWAPPQNLTGNQFLHQFSTLLQDEGHHEKFCIIAQIGVGELERGKRSGVGSQMYDHFFEKIIPNTNFKEVLTEISPSNKCSLYFHEKNGFQNLYAHNDDFGNKMIVFGRKVNQKK
jgi:hypothetical protein